MVPTRLVNLSLARTRFGDRADRLAPLLLEGDALGDAAAEALATLPSAERHPTLDRLLTGENVPSAPEPLRALAAQVRHVPFWVDFARADRGGRALLRTGVFGGFVLAFRSLVLGYCAPAGNKPLAFSGRLKEQANRRVAETSRFVQAVCLPGGMREGRDGFKTSVRVRLMHAQVRRLLSKSPRWDAAAWGTPICQLDMSATVLLFSQVVIEGLAKLGVPLSSEEAEDLLHLWRYVGYVLGVREELLPATLAEATTHAALIELTQGAPDDDSRALARALMEIPLTDAKTQADRARAQRFVPVTYAISRLLIGDERADALGYPKSPWLWAAPALTALFSRTSLVRKLPGVDRVILEAGLGYWRRVVSLGLGGEEATFAMPDAVPYA
jgi:hypothetical protein